MFKLLIHIIATYSSCPACRNVPVGVSDTVAVHCGVLKGFSLGPQLFITHTKKSTKCFGTIIQASLFCWWHSGLYRRPTVTG